MMAEPVAPNPTYNGWKNYQTRNVSLWIANDEVLYKLAEDFMRHRPHKFNRSPYRTFLYVNGMEGRYTPDGVQWDCHTIDYRAMNRFMRELVS